MTGEHAEDFGVSLQSPRRCGLLDRELSRYERDHRFRLGLQRRIRSTLWTRDRMRAMFVDAQGEEEALDFEPDL